MSDTRQNVLQAARTLFAQQGYTATSVRQIAEAAGIGKATIYHHFPDKETIALALLEESLGRMDAILPTAGAADDPRQRIRAMAKVSIEYLFESADLWQVVRREVPGGRKAMETRLALFFQDYIALIASTVQRGVDQGLFRPLDPTQAARVFLMMIQGSFALALFSGNIKPEPSEIVATVLEIFFRGIEAP
jgi:AcrR family transcriptional regulator